MNIFIAGLSYNLSEAELEELFAEYGQRNRPFQRIWIC